MGFPEEKGPQMMPAQGVGGCSAGFMTGEKPWAVQRLGWMLCEG